jgi:hypothetical protein
VEVHPEDKKGRIQIEIARGQSVELDRKEHEDEGGKNNGEEVGFEM